MRIAGSNAVILGLLTMKNGWGRVNEGLDCGKDDGNERRADNEIRLANFKSYAEYKNYWLLERPDQGCVRA